MTTTVLVIAEHDSATIKSATFNAVTATKACNDAEVYVLVAGLNAIVAAQAATQIAGMAKVMHADGASLADSLAEDLAARVLAVTTNYSHILFLIMASGKNVAPCVAAKLDVAQISGIIKVKSLDASERPIYAGNAIVLIQPNDAIKIVTAQTTALEAAAATGGPGIVEVTECVADSGQSRLVGRGVTVSDRPELASAEIVVSGDRALGSAGRFSEVVTPLTDKLGTAVGTNRTAVDAGYTPNDLQVGQTGKTVASQPYTVLGISGATQYLAGMKDPKAIMAINKDPEAPIFLIAGYRLATSLLTVVPELVKTP